MDKLSHYRQLLRQIVKQHVEYPSYQDYIDTLAVCDEATDNYLMLDIEASRKGTQYWVIFHLRLRDGKVRIEKDGIEYGIAQDLLEAGIAEEDIVYALPGTAASASEGENQDLAVA